MKRLLLFLLISVLCLAGVSVLSQNNIRLSSTDQETLTVANHLYSNGDFEDATQLYQQLVDQGVHNFDVYYNLGNAYFQLADYGRAILNYERAQRLNPRDTDLKANLQTAREQAGDNTVSQTRSPLGQLVDVAQSTFTINELALLSLASVFVVVCLWQAQRITTPVSARRVLALLLIVTVLGIGVSTVMLGATLYNRQVQPEGIVLNQTSLNGVNLASGMKVEILEERGDTVRIALSGRNVEGWISADSIGAI